MILLGRRRGGSRARRLPRDVQHLGRLLDAPTHDELHVMRRPGCAACEARPLNSGAV